MSHDHNLELFELKAKLCRAFADPKRLIIISLLRDGEKTVGDLVQMLQIPQAVVSRQLGVLRSNGVVAPRREGTNVFYRLTDSRIGEACDLVHDILLNQITKSSELVERLRG
ncbi:ArsR/SmtB family transcription factor [Chloroflexota bacterium]